MSGSERRRDREKHLRMVSQRLARQGNRSNGNGFSWETCRVYSTNLMG